MFRAPKSLLVVLLASLLPWSSCAQGLFAGSNASNRTRVGTADGPLAGTNIWGQFFAGPTSSSLTPVANTAVHQPGGVFAPGVISVPGLAAFTTAFVQLVAWDSTQWGTEFSNVPLDQLGYTDIVSVWLTDGDFYVAPVFTQPAIVPIPEPSTWALLALGVLGFWVTRARR